MLKSHGFSFSQIYSRKCVKDENGYTERIEKEDSRSNRMDTKKENGRMSVTV